MKLLKFGASWCGPCRKLKEDFKHITLPIECIEVEVDDEENEEFVSRYDVMNIPCLVLVTDEGVEVSRKIGALPIKSIIEWIKSYQKDEK